MCQTYNQEDVPWTKELKITKKKAFGYGGEGNEHSDDLTCHPTTQLEETRSMDYNFNGTVKEADF